MRLASMLMAVVAASLSLQIPVYASPMQCGGNLVSAGDTPEQVLEACGEPASRDGNRWTYAPEGDLPKILTFGEGVVMSIHDGDDPGFADSSPLGNHP